MTLLLYPEYSRKELEVQYHGMAAALWRAAEEKWGHDTEQIVKQIGTWLDASIEDASTSAVVQMTRNLAQVEGTKQ